MKQDGRKQPQGFCTMQYFQSFIIVLFLFFSFLNYFCPLLDYQYWILLFYCSLKKKKTSKQVPFLYQTICCMNVYCLGRAAEINRLMQGHPSNPFILKVPKTRSIILWLKKSTTALRRRQTQLNRKRTESQRSTDFFRKSDILFQKFELLVSLKDSGACPGVLAGAQWMITVTEELKEWKPAEMTATHIHLLLSLSWHPLLLHLSCIFNTFTVSPPVDFMISH